MLGRVVGGVVLPASPDDGGPGAGEDTNGVWVVAVPGPGLGVEIRGPGVGVSGVAGEVTERSSGETPVGPGTPQPVAH